MDNTAAAQHYRYLEARRTGFSELNKGVKPGGIVFTGDSITDWFPIHELLPKDLPLHNRGISGHTSEGLLDMIDEQILQLKPSKVFLLIGINDIGIGFSIEDVAENIQEICGVVTSRLESCKVYVESVYPMNPLINPNIAALCTSEVIRQLNTLIKTRIEPMPGVTYIDLYPELTDGQGNLIAVYTYDGLHLTVAGYQKIIALLKPYIT